MIHIENSFATEPPELDFVIPGYLAGTVGCVAAAGSTGKSFWALEAAMGVASGEADKSLLQLNPARHGRVVILNAEDPATVIRQRLFDIGKNLSPQAREEVVADLQIEALVGKMTNLLDPKWQEVVLKLAENARLVIFDTFSRWHRLNENNNGEMASVLSIMEMVSNRTNSATLFT